MKDKNISKVKIKDEILSKELLREKQLSKASSEERKVLKRQFRTEDKQIIKAMKETYKKEKGDQRKQSKRDYKYYKKFNNRKIRLWRNSIVSIIVLALFIQAAPYIGNAIKVFGAKHIKIDTESELALVAREHGEKISKQIADEGLVLLENDGLLPLEDKKVNVFGVSAHHIRYGGGGSGSSDTSRAVDLFTALETEGISYNQELADFYDDLGKKIAKEKSSGLGQVIQGFLGTNNLDEPQANHLDETMISNAQSFSDQALVVISSSGTEASDFTDEQLRLTENKRALIETVSKHFEDVIVVINAGNTLELGFIEEFENIRAVVWVGTPGPYGMTSLAQTLTGEINPSGRLVDTYAYNTETAPASVNFGDYQYDNLDKAWIAYEEGIYVGYRFYETYYQDESEYREVVQYPFGYGLSYTDFSWEILNEKVDNDNVTVEIKVSNNGQIPGKDVVQLYYSAPFIDGGLEKSAINLVGYAKTDLLKENESQILELSFPLREMASYDKEEEAFVLDQGAYEFFVSKNVHDHVHSFTHDLNESVIYRVDEKTKTAYQNVFADAQGDFTYLSRSDWETTYPQEKERKVKIDEAFIEEINKPQENIDVAMPKFKQDHGIMFKDLKGLDYDDPKWQAFIEQWSVEELMNFVVYGAYHTEENERLGLESSVLMDGPAGLSYFFGDVKASAYPTEVVVASTWNDQLAYDYGEAVGKEAKVYGVHGWYAPAMNLHRTAKGGRNFEYFSEDPLLSGKMSAAITKGAQSQDIIVFMKHFALNDQETNARSGIVVWADEQAIRELYLKPFEITVKEGGALGAMSSFSYIGPKWAGAHSGLLNDVLREEWGFEGIVSTDAVFSFMHANQAIVNGNDLMLDILLPHNNYKRLKKAYKENPELIANGLQQSAHNILFALSKTHLID